jgi:sugar lactone lactonase YvrE
MTNTFDEIQCAVPAGDICGEGAVWHPDDGALYWTDINRFLVHRFELANRTTQTWLFEEPVTSVNLTTDPDRLLLVFGSRVGLWSPFSHPAVETIFHLPSAPEMRFNDASVDPRGSLWVGTMRNNVGPQGEDLDVPFSGGVLYRLDPGGGVTEWKHDIGISNTVAWSPEYTTFYFGDSIANAIHSFSYDRQSGAISGERPFLVGYAKGAPDGSAMDAQGYLWNTRPGAGCLIRVASDGRIDRVVLLPDSNPTTCAFGGPNLDILFITSARSANRLSGSLFAFRPGVSGLAKGRFRTKQF